MRGYEAYRQTRNIPITRIDVILELYRVALESIRRAQQALPTGGRDAARPILLKCQTAIMGLAAGLPAHKEDELAVTFLRLYTFASAQVVEGTNGSLEAAADVLQKLFESFQKVRDEAAALELSNQIRPLDRDQLVSVKA